MSRTTPSLLALLGLVAVAGYQNRGRISEMLADARSRNDKSVAFAPGAAAPGAGGFLAEIGQFFQANPGGSSVTTALRDLVDRFKSAGQTATADSWVSDRPNLPATKHDLEAALGDETLEELGRKTGLSRADLVTRLNAALPEVVNRLTPNGRLPTDDEGGAMV